MTASPDDEATPYRLQLQSISKSYGGVRAIRHADFAVKPGTVHALVGENGAGKSTLIKIIAGAERPDTGSMLFDGASVSVSSTSDAIRLGIQTVYQEPQLFSELSVAENIFIGRELKTAGRVDWRKESTQIKDLLETVGLPSRVAPVSVGALSIAQQQQVSIAKALAHDASVLILDEPSAILTDAEIEILFSVIRRLTVRGVSVIYISHRLDELFVIAQEVTVMRDGQTITTRPIGELNVREVVELMVGDLDAQSRAHGAAATRAAAAPLLELEGLGRRGQFHDVDLVVHQGEIVGLYGLIGSGAGQVAEVVYGMSRPTSGSMRVRGKPTRVTSPSHARRLGIRMVPANRSLQGVFSFQSIAFNIVIGDLAALSRLPGIVSGRRQREIAKDFIRRLSIKTPSERQPVSAMSGGNAQKVVLARQLVATPALLILAEPTQGVDVGAKEEIHRIVSRLADEGAGVLVTTTDVAEALRICDRILVLRDGAVVAEFGPEVSQVDVLAAAAGDRVEQGERHDA